MIKDVIIKFYLRGWTAEEYLDRAETANIISKAEKDKAKKDKKDKKGA